MSKKSRKDDLAVSLDSNATPRSNSRIRDCTLTYHEKISAPYCHSFHMWHTNAVIIGMGINLVRGTSSSGLSKDRYRQAQVVSAALGQTIATTLGELIAAKAEQTGVGSELIVAIETRGGVMDVRLLDEQVVALDPATAVKVADEVVKVVVKGGGDFFQDAAFPACFLRIGRRGRAVELGHGAWTRTMTPDVALEIAAKIRAAAIAASTSMTAGAS